MRTKTKAPARKVIIISVPIILIILMNSITQPKEWRPRKRGKINVLVVNSRATGRENVLSKATYLEKTTKRINLRLVLLINLSMDAKETVLEQNRSRDQKQNLYVINAI